MILLFAFYYKLPLLLFGVCVALILFGLRSSRDIFKHIFFNATAVMMAFMVFETYLVYQEVGQDDELACEGTVTGPEDQDFVVPDKKFGYRVADQGIFHAVKNDRIHQQNVYDVNYTIKNGMRVTPSNHSGTTESYYFLGCSNTFGFGLDDYATLPHQFGDLSCRDVHIKNLGVNGYGTHQVYQQIMDLPNDVEEVKVIYSFLVGHISRAAGYSSWDRQGPRYEVVNDQVKNTGPFECEQQNPFLKMIDQILLKSRIYKRFFKHYFRPITDRDIDRTAALIIAAAEELKRKGYEFHLFIHDIDEHIQDEFQQEIRYQRFINQLTNANIRLHYLSEVISDYEEQIDQYTHGFCDRHPNAQANAMIASYFVEVFGLSASLANTDNE